MTKLDEHNVTQNTSLIDQSIHTEIDNLMFCHTALVAFFASLPFSSFSEKQK